MTDLELSNIRLECLKIATGSRPNADTMTLIAEADYLVGFVLGGRIPDQY